MDTNVPSKLSSLLEEKSYLLWWVKDTSNISLEMTVFVILNFGDFSDVELLFSELTPMTVKKIFKEQITHRNDYAPEVVNYFNLYLEKHAQ